MDPRAILAAMTLVLVIPAVGAQGMEMDVEMTFSADFTTMTMDMTISMGGEGASGMRQAMDEMGNQDGRASQEEADAMMEMMGSEMESTFSDGFGSDDLTLDGKGPTRVDMASLTLRNVAGPVTSEAPIDIVAVLTATFQPVGTGKHTLVMGGDDGEPSDPDPDIEGTFLMRAPTGYVIEEYPEGTGISLSADRRTLTVDAASAGDSDMGDATIVFAPASSGKSSPGAGLLVVTVALAGAVVARRRLA